MIKDLLSRLEPIKRESGFRIRYNGHFVRLTSGKHLWTTKCAAKLAVRNEFAYDVRKAVDGKRNFTEQKEKFFKKIFDEVEIVELHE